MRKLVTILALFCALLTPAAALDVAALEGRVVDEANLFDQAQRQALENKLADLEARTARKLVVITVPPTPEATAEGYGLELRKLWGVNQNGNRVALIVSPKTGRSVIQFDRGLSDTLPVSVTDTIFQQVLNPRIRSGDVAGGLTAASDSIIRVLDGETLPQAQPPAPPPQRVAQNSITVPATAEFPALSGRVVDDAGILDAATREALRAKLAAHEAATSNQIVVATVKSLNGNSIEDYANRLFRRWQLGQKGKNNGVLLLHAPTERKIRIEVGYGLEGTLTDAITKVIITNAIAPRFKTNDFNGGMTRGVDDIIKVLSGGAEEFKQRASPPARSWFTNINPEVLFILVPFALFLIINTVIGGMQLLHAFLISIGVAKRRPRNGFWHSVDNWSFSTSSGSSSGSSSSSWGSSSSSSGDSFSGGGGDSGGGGSSGDY